MNTNKEVKKYIKEIKLLLPAYGNSERAFLTDLVNRIYEVVQESPDITIEDIKNQFGTPLDISQSYIESIDMNVLIKRLSIIRIVRYFLVAFIICSILAVSIFAGFIYKAYLDSRNTVVTHTETIITDE